MAVKEKPIAKGHFKAGHNNVNRRNGVGRIPNKVAKQIRRLTMDEVADLASLLMSHTRLELRTILEDPKSSVLRCWFAAVAIKGISKGDPSALGSVLDRIVGKVKDKVEVSGSQTEPFYARLEAMTAKERDQELIRIRKMRELASAD